MEAATATLYNRILARDKRTLLQYLGDTYPWVDGAHADIPVRLNKMAVAEAKATSQLAAWLIRRHIPPVSMAFPMEFTNLHFVAIDHLLPQLLLHQRRAIEQLEADLTRLPNEEPRSFVEAMLELKRRNLSEMEQLNASFGGKFISTLR